MTRPLLHKPTGRIMFRRLTSLFSVLVFCVALTFAVPAEAAQPHGGYSKATDKCQMCHGMHGSEGGKILVKPDEKQLCYACHDGTGSVYDARTEFGESTLGTTTARSSHPVPAGRLSCEACHTPHRGPEDGNPMALSVGESRTATGSAVCGGCHGSGSSLPGGDHMTAIAGTPHETGVPAPASGSGVKCLACHAPHASSNPSLIKPAAKDAWGTTRTIDTSGSVTPLCLACHAKSAEDFPGEAVYSEAPHGAVATSSVAATSWPGLGKRNGDCDNCHEPHGKAPGARYTRADGDDLCLTCHDAPGTTKPAGYSYRGGTPYATSSHAGVSRTVAYADAHSDSDGFAAWEATKEPTPSAPGAPLADDRLRAMRYVDSQMAVTALATDTGTYDYQMYRFRAPAGVGDLRPMTLEWVGYAEALAGYPLKLSVWDSALNAGSGGWETLSNGVVGTETTLTATIPASSEHVSADRYVYVLATSRHARKAEITSGPYASAATTTSVEIRWTTTGPSSSWVDIGPTIGYGGTFGSAEPTTTHLVVVPLPSAGVYHYRVTSSDADGVTTTTPDAVFGAPSPVALHVAGGPNVTSVTATWTMDEAFRGPYTYQVSLRDSAGTVTQYPWQSTTSLALSLPYDSYTWWVTAKDASGTLTARSNADSFTTYYYDPSCPILYAWDGRDFRFVTDVMGLGDLGIQTSPGVYRYPPAIEDSKIPSGLLRADDGAYELRLKNEKDEIEYADALSLWAIDHPAGTNVYVNDLTRSVHTRDWPDTKIYTTRDERPVKATYTDVPLYTGPAVTAEDVTSELERSDHTYAPARLFDDNQYVFDLGDLRDASRIKLVVEGWTQYATPAERAAWLQSGAKRADRVLEVADADGNWVPVESDMPYIAGYTKTAVFDLTGKFPAGVRDYKVRMRGLYRTYLDRVAVDTSPDAKVTVHRLAPSAAKLGFRGVARYSADPAPEYTYADIVTRTPKLHSGAFTRYGDVLPLLTGSDDMFVVMDSGDELSLRFPVPAKASGAERDFVMHTDGYFQELTGKVEPMPFHAMSNFPYGADEHYPDDATHTAYLAEWNTRVHGGASVSASRTTSRPGLVSVLSSAWKAFASIFTPPARSAAAASATRRSIHTDAVYMQFVYTAAGTAGTSCTACHEVHGQPSSSGSPYPALLAGNETRTCTGDGGGSCHSSAAASAAGVNVYAAITASATPSTHHDLTSSAQSASGARIACSSCHDPHRENGTVRYSNPDSIDQTLSAPAPADLVGPDGSVYALVGARHDGLPPVVSMQLLTVSSAGTPTVTWTTDEPATTWLDWGTTTAYELGTFGGASLVTSHASAPDTWTTGVVYHYRIRSADALGNESVSSDCTFTALPAMPAPVPDKIADASGYAPVSVTMSCTPVGAPDGHAAQYQFTWRNVAGAGTGSSPWVATPSYSVGLAGATWAYSVKARDAVETYSVSPSSAESTFTVTDTTPPGTCPYLFSDDGSGMRFESDLYGSSKLAVKTSSGFLTPYAQDYYLLRRDPSTKDGRIDLSLVEERLEADYLDELGLYAVDAPVGREVYAEMPQQGTAIPAFPGLGGVLHTVLPDAPAPRSAKWLNTGQDVESTISASDGRMVQLNADRNDFTYQTLELDLGDIASAPQTKLIVDGRTMFPDTPAGIALAQKYGPRTMLQVQDASGSWVSVTPSSGPLPKPAEFYRPYVLDISSVWKSSSRKVRLTFLFKTYIDSIRVDTTRDEPLTFTRQPLLSATLRPRGVDRIDAPGSEFYEYVYGKPSGMFEYFPGAYTRFGDITPLLARTDDEFAIYGGGDEVAASFGAGSPPAAGYARHWLVFADGYYKDQKSDCTKTVEPLPFAGMTTYPYPSTERYPADAEHTAYRQEWNTRVYGTPDSTTPVVFTTPSSGGPAVSVQSIDLLGRVWRWFSQRLTDLRLALAPAPAPAPHTYRFASTAEPGPNHYSLNTDAIALRSDGLDRAPVSFAPVEGWQSTGATPTPSAPGSASSVTEAASADGSYWTTSLTSTDKAWNWQVARFSLSSAEANAASDLRVVWDGYGEPSAGYPTVLAVWDFKDARWVTVSRTAFGSPGEIAVSRGRVPASLCLTCHDGTPPAGVTVPAGLANIGATWTAARHGGTPSAGFGGALIGEYQRNVAPNIECATCHDPHGNANLYHIASSIKDSSGIAVTKSSDLAAACGACHKGSATDWHDGGCSCHASPSTDPDDPHDAYGAWHPTNASDCLRCHAHGRTFVHKDCHGACHMSWGPTL